MVSYGPVRRTMFGRAACWLVVVLAALGLKAGIAKPREVNAWSGVQALGSTPNGGGSSIAASGANVYVAYGNGPVFFRRSNDAGQTFSEPIRLAGNGRVIHETDSIGAAGSDVFVVTFARTAQRRDWCCDRDLGNLMLQRSTDAGTSWQAEVPLTSSGTAFRVSIAVSLPYVHVVWSDFRGGRWAIYYRRSPDGGATWEPEQRLVAPGLEETNRPQIAALGKDVHITWPDNRDGNDPCYTLPHCTETYYIHSPDAGASWTSPRRLTFNPPQKPLLSGRSDVAAFDNGALIVLYDQDLKFGGAGVQHVLRSPDRGKTWQPPLKIGRKPEETHSAAAALGQDGVVAWFDQQSGLNLGVFARVTEDSGITWQKEERVSPGDRPASTPHVVFTPGFLHVVWLEQRPDGQWVVDYRRRAMAAP